MAPDSWFPPFLSPYGWSPYTVGVTNGALGVSVFFYSFLAIFRIYFCSYITIMQCIPMVFFASIPLLLGILYIKVYFSPSLRTFYLFFLQESVCSGPFLLSWDLDHGCESSSHGARVSFHQSGFFLSFSLDGFCLGLFSNLSISLQLFHSVVKPAQGCFYFRCCNFVI